MHTAPCHSRCPRCFVGRAVAVWVLAYLLLCRCHAPPMGIELRAVRVLAACAYTVFAISVWELIKTLSLRNSYGCDGDASCLWRDGAHLQVQPGLTKASGHVRSFCVILLLGNMNLAANVLLSLVPGISPFDQSRLCLIGAASVHALPIVPSARSTTAHSIIHMQLELAHHISVEAGAGASLDGTNPYAVRQCLVRVFEHGTKPHESNKYSHLGEDGILDHIWECIAPESKYAHPPGALCHASSAAATQASAEQDDRAMKVSPN